MLRTLGSCAKVGRVKKYFLSHMMVGRSTLEWMNQHTVDAPSINVFAGRLDK